MLRKRTQEKVGQNLLKRAIEILISAPENTMVSTDAIALLEDVTAQISLHE